MTAQRLPITPQTKVSDLLREYPELQEVLITIAPAFKKLHNPVLLRTVARVTSLSQAARVGGVPVADLVRQLRQAVGQPSIPEDSEAKTTTDLPATAPAWFAPEKIVTTFDARRMIESGEQPIGYVLTDLDRLQPGQIYELVTPFEPAPLMDKAISRGFSVWTRKVSATEQRTSFLRT